jgi:uncharacterized protein YbjT (DUF2867 family)
MNKILITGGTGTIGSALVQRLRELGADFVVMSSKPSAGVQGDFNDPGSLDRAFTRVDTLFLLFPFVPNMLELARNAVAAARATGVKHIVRSSGAGADAASPVSIARVQGEIDALVTASGIPYTLLRPSSFMQNWVTFLAAQVKAGVVYAPHGAAAYSVIDARDIADAAAAVLVDPARHAGRAYTLTGGQALSDAQMVAAISSVIGREVGYVDVPESAAIEAMTGMGMPQIMIDWLMSLNHVIKQGWAAGVSADVRLLTGHEPRLFEDFVREHMAAWR